MKASYLLKPAMVCLAASVVSATALFSGVQWAKFLVFVFVPLGALIVLVGTVLALTGGIEDDLKRRK